MIAVLILFLCVLAMLLCFVGVIVCMGVFADKLIDILQGGYDNDNE